MNINRDYLIINDVKKSNIKLDNGSMFFYITDKNTQNIFVNLVINVSNNDLIQKYANIENAEDYTLTMNIVKPDNTYKIIEGKLHDKEKAIFEFNLNEDCCDEIGTYRCELLTKCNINDHEEITTSNKLTYKVKSSVLNDLDDIVEAPEYPLVIQLFDKLSDIEQYEEDRRANELARQLAEEQRQAKHDKLVSDMTDSIQAMDDKVVEVENRISAKEQVVDKLITDTKADIDDYKVAKDQEIDEYKTAKDTEINNAITAQDNKIDEAIANQDNKIDTAISEQNNRIAVVENNDVAQNNRLDTLENRATQHESRLTDVEAKNAEQDDRLDVVENKNAQQDNRLDAIEAKNVEQDNRLNEIEAIDVAQNTRLDAIEAKNTEQDDRLLDIEKVNKRQDMNLKCLFAESKNNMIDVTEEGNSIYLQNSTTGYALIDEIKGNTLVNCNKEPNKELILNGNINTSGDNAVTITEGVDGGLVDVTLEGNTLVNVSKTKDSTAISKAYTVENSGNHIALQGDIDGSCRPVITGNTLWIDNDTEEVLTAFDETKNLRLQSSFEDNLVTQEMVDSGEEVADNLGKYRVDYKVTGGKNLLDQSKGVMNAEFNSKTICIKVKPNTSYAYSSSNYKGGIVVYELPYKVSNGSGILEVQNITLKMHNIVDRQTFTTGGFTSYILLNYDKESDVQLEEGDTATSYEPYKEYTKTLYLNSPLLEGDTIEERNGSIYHVHRSGKYTFTGKETWGIQQPGNSNTYYCNISHVISNIPNRQVYNVLCDRIQVLGLYDRSRENIYVAYNNQVVYTPLAIETVTNAWLQNKTAGATIIYPLASPTYELIEQSNLTIPSYANGHLDFNTAVPVEKVEFKPFSEELTYLYANTQYTIQFISTRAILVDYYLGGTLLLSQSIVQGLNRISITTPSELVDNKLTINGNDTGANIMEVIVTDIDRELIYFEGMKSVGEGKELQVISINSERRLVNTQRLTHEPLRGTRDAKDRYVLIDGKWYIERKCGIRAYQEGDKDNYKTDLINTVYPLETPTYEPIDYNPLEVYSGTTHITTNSTIPANITVKNHGYNCLLKPSTTYTISSNLGLNTVTTPSSLTEDCLRFMDTDTSDVTTMKNVLVLEGDWTTKADLIPANFSGIESAFEQEYDVEKGKYKVNAKVVGKNLFNPNNILLGKYINNSNYNYSITSHSNYAVIVVPIINKDKVVVSVNSGTFGLARWDDINGNLIRGIAEIYNKSNTVLTPPSPNCVLKVCIYKSIINNNIQIEQGDTASEYEPYKENNITFYINEPLRGIGDIKDKVFIKDDKVVVERNCAIRPYEDGDFGTYPTDKVNTIYQLAEPVYEEVEYNDTKLFIESFKNSTLSYNSNVPVTSKLYYSYSVPIVDTVAQTANISDEQDSMIIGLATQVAVMEMMLM